jgi:hypothetical protein
VVLDNVSKRLRLFRERKSECRMETSAHDQKQGLLICCLVFRTVRGQGLVVGGRVSIPRER